MTRQSFKGFLAAALLSLAAISVLGQGAPATATVSGRVTYGANNDPLHNASVQLVQLKRTVQTDADGAYRFENVAPGRYTILAHQDGFSDITQTVVLTAGAAQTVDFRLQVAGVTEQVTVTASGAEQSTFESFQSVETLSSDQITRRASTSLGEVLEGEPGVAKRSFGVGSSRPVIRGFDGDRVLVAQDGVRSGSLASQSGDHGEPVDTLSVERIEVVKGPATLLYGSNAIGGVVNVISNHEDAAHKGLRGFFTGLAGTNNNQAGASGGLEYGFSKVMLFGEGSFQRTGDYRSPLGPVPNSAARSKYGSVGGGYFDDKAFFTTTFSADDRRYGIPFAGFIESGGVSNDEEIDLSARTYNLKFNGGFRDVDAFVTSGKFTVNFNKYRHREIEDGEVGTNFFNRTVSYRGLLEQKPFGGLTGRFGFEGFNRDYETIGEEQLIDGAVRQNSFSVFALEEMKMGRLSFQFGGRVERNAYNAENPGLRDRSFTGFSGAAGVRVGLWENGALVVNYTNSYRAPALEELYNNGPHIGTVSFEVGDENLERERAQGVDFGLRHQSARVRANLDVFYYRINNFVYLAYADEDGDSLVDREDNLPVARYSQAAVRYYGAEFDAEVSLHKYVNLFFNTDFVRASLVDSDLNLPRIPPARARLGFDFRRGGLSVRPEAYFAAEQDRLHPLETRTAGYGIFNLGASYTHGTQHYAHVFGVNAYNLFDKEYRNHLSFIKDLAPEIGRGVRFSYTIRFF